MSLSSGSPTGQIFSCTCYAQAVTVIAMGVSYVADFNGSLAVLLDPVKLQQFLVGAVDIVDLLIQDHVSHGVGAGIGPIEVRIDPVRVPSLSTITAQITGQAFPAVQDMRVNIYVTMDNILKGITLRNVIKNPGPAILRNSNVTAFPPNGDVYQLVEPIDLEDINNPGPVLATIQNFPVVVNPPTP